MIHIKVILENEEYFTTNINLSFEEAQKYYVGNKFNIGVVEDKILKCVKVEKN